MGVVEPVKRLTEAEYLDLERDLESRNEFFDGEMFAMSGGTPLHSQIATNLARQENQQWLLREAAGLKATLTLPSLEIKISLSEVFAGVEFVPAPIRARTPPRH